MFQSRNEVRQVYIDVWQKMQHKQLLQPMEALIAEVMELHPEYHALFDNRNEALNREYSPESGESNPFLHMGMHLALREQASTDRPGGFKRIYQKLVKKLGLHDAEHEMMSCLAEALWYSQKYNQPFDDTSYLSCLKKIRR